MGKVICVNGESIVCMSSDGKLTTSSTCMTPPFCVPIPYTNLGESLMADQTCSSITMGGNPVCNQKSTFKVTKGDGPGVCGGVASGTTMQIAQFKEGSKTVNFAGNPAVHNGLLMDSNNTNTGPQPLQQPPCTNPPAGTAEAPVAEKGEFSQQFDFSSLIGFAPGEQYILERPYYEIWTKEGQNICNGNLSNKGLTERAFTPEKQNLIVWLGDGEWKMFGEHNHDTYEDDAEKNSDAETATIRFGFVNFARAAITQLDYKFVVNGETISGKSNETGGAEVLSKLKPGTLVEVSVLSDKTKDYKKIGTVNAQVGETHYTIVSPKIKIESATEKHVGEAGKPAAAPKLESNQTAKNATITPQKTETLLARNAAGNPQASVKEETLKTLLIKGFLQVYNYWTWADFIKSASASTPTQGHPKVNPPTSPSMAALGTALTKDNLERLQKLVKIAEGQVVMDFRSCKGQKDKKGNAISSTQAVLDKFAKEGDAPDFGEKKSPSQYNKMCLSYVKVALHRANYITGTPPGTDLAKNSGGDWVSAGFQSVGSSLPQVEISYAKKKGSTLPEDTKINQPDLIYSLPGDVIVYEQVDLVDPGAAGHIDIRTYHSFCADFARAHPLPALGTGSGTHFKVIGVYRKISDTMAMARVEAFLRIIREQVAGETSLKVKDRSYHLLTYDKDSKDPFAEGNMNGDLSKGHPSDEIKRKPAGAYQIRYKEWDDTIIATGWPETFAPEMQDRIAMYLLQAYPGSYPHKRRSALGYIMEGEVEKAINIIKQEENLSNWHGIINAKFIMSSLKPVFDKYTKEASK